VENVAHARRQGVSDLCVRNTLRVPALGEEGKQPSSEEIKSKITNQHFI